MKKIIVGLIMLLLSIPVFSQVVEGSRVAVQNSDIIVKDGDTTKSFTLQKVMDFPGISKAELLSASKAWMIETFRTGTVNNRVVDAEGSYIIDKPVFGYYYQHDQRVNSMASRCHGNIMYTFRLDFKDGKARMMCTDFIHNSIDWVLFGRTVHYDMGRITNADMKNDSWPKWKQNCWYDAKKQIVDVFNVLSASYEKFVKSYKGSNAEW